MSLPLVFGKLTVCIILLVVIVVGFVAEVDEFDRGAGNGFTVVTVMPIGVI